MADILLAGSKKETFGGIGKMFKKGEEDIEKINAEITDPDFLKKIDDRHTGVIISRFNEGDLASIKAMQTIKLKKPSITFIFISDKELSGSIMTLVFNEGAYGVIHEPVSKESARQLIKQAIKRSKWDMDHSARCEDLKTHNEKLKDCLARAEAHLSRMSELNEKLERLVDFLLIDKTFRPSSVKILFVTNSPYQRGLLLDIFGKIGFNVKNTSSGEEALETIKSFAPEIVVSDMELEGISGVELSKEVKGKKGYPYLYFIILTANEEKLDYILSPETFVDDCVIKPSDQEKYHEMVAKIALGILTV